MRRKVQVKAQAGLFAFELSKEIDFRSFYVAADHVADVLAECDVDPGHKGWLVKVIHHFFGLNAESDY